MRDYAVEAVSIVADRQVNELETDRLLRHGLVRLIEIVGEAANRVSEEVRGAHAEIPWREIIGMRHRLIHGYDSVDQDLLWHVVKEDLPVLIKNLKKILE